MKKIAFVIPWYGETISGGAEAELRDLVHHLAAEGVELEVLTTCVYSFSSPWNENYYSAGLTFESGIPVRRFKVRKADPEKFNRINRKCMAGEKISFEEEEIFLNETVNSPKLYQYIRRHQKEYSLFIFIPYMFGPTYFGVQQCPEKSVLIPCFHDESYFYFRHFQTAYEKVAGMIFNALPEKLLAEQAMDLSAVRKTVMGIGLDTDLSGNAERFRRQHGIREPFLLYAGRKDAGKNVDVLLRYFSCFKRQLRSDLKLVLIGGGNISIPGEVADDVIDLGFLPAQDKYDACAAAELLCQPSPHESFSLVIMESWLCGRPVLVSGECPVTKNFVQEANGGLYFSSYGEFACCVKYLLNHKETAAAMGANGREYVRQNFAWSVIMDRYRTFFKELTENAES